MVAGPGLVGLSADAWLGIGKEPTGSYGTKTGPAGGEFFLFLSESLKSDRPLVPVPIISAAYLDVAQKFQGAQVVSGDVELACTYDSMQNLLLHCFGQINNAASGASGSFSRNFDLASKGRWRASPGSPALTFHVARGIVGSGNTSPAVFSYDGCLIDSFQFSCGRDQPLKLRMSIFGRNETVAVYSGTPSFPTAPVINFNECTATWGGTEIPITDFTITVNRNIDKDRIFAGDLFTNEPPMGQYEVKVQCGSEWDNEKRVGTATLRDDFIAQTPRALNFSFLSTNTISGTSLKYQFNLQLAQAIISAFNPTVSGRGRVTVPLQFQGFDSDVTSAPHELRLATVDARNFSDN